MISSIIYVLLYLIPCLIPSGSCAVELFPPPPALRITSPGELEYTDVLVKRVGDNLTLVCEFTGEGSPRFYVWNYLKAGANITDESGGYQVEPAGEALNSTLRKTALHTADSGHYICSSPPLSVTKFVLVQQQPRGGSMCARGAFWCGHCVLGAYVCDGFRDCRRGEDEAPALCHHRPCASSSKLNCSSGRCIPEAACCRPGATLCRQPACCDEHPEYSRLDGFGAELEYPPLFEDRHAPDEYGFIQSTIYTVTACALIFMIAVVLLVSALCKMHMKRAALRGYAHDRATAAHYTVQYAQTHRFPPCYEASRLLEQERALSPSHSPHSSPARTPLQCSSECPVEGAEAEPAGGLARLSALFSSRYRQVPTQCLDVEMTDVRSASLNSSPTRSRTRPRLADYRSPTYCDLNTDLFYNTETSACGRDLNYMATPLEFYRRRTLRNNIDRVLDQINRPRPLTLQLGRFQLSIPRLGRRPSSDRRPDTPNVAELNVDELDFVHLNSNDTYTLNGRTIRLLGADFENYPALNEANRPPPYNEAVRYKLYGPPPEYLSRDCLNNGSNGNNVTNVTVTEEQARSNVEMPPCYEDLASGVDVNANGTNNEVTEQITVTNNVISNVADNETGNLRSVIDNLPAIDSDVNANEADTVMEVNNVNNNC